MPCGNTRRAMPEPIARLVTYDSTMFSSGSLFQLVCGLRLMHQSTGRDGATFASCSFRCDPEWTLHCVQSVEPRGGSTQPTAGPALMRMTKNPHKRTRRHRRKMDLSEVLVA
jgi:hypothetical protein